MDYGIDFKIFV